MLRAFFYKRPVGLHISAFNNYDMRYLCKRAKNVEETSNFNREIVKNASYFS